ncbi:MAG: hypothetical protein ABW033_07110 [Acidimicrobiia bacterium]
MATPVEHLVERSVNTPRLAHRGRFLTTTWLLAVGADEYRIRIDDGVVTSVDRGTYAPDTFEFSLRAPAADWALFWSADPPAGSHDLFALLKRGALEVEGNLQPFMANLQYIKDLLATLRETSP